MTRHARNNTASAVYSYHERQRDTKSSGYGTQKARLAKDSVKDFDACNLTLQPCRNPIVTPDGYLFDKEAILEYIVHQKAEIARKMKEYEKQRKREVNELAELAAAEERSKTEAFLRMENGVVATNSKATAVGSSISNMSEGRDKKLPSFWVPQMTPRSSQSKLQKPDKTVYCPMSGKPLKMKDFIPVIFTPVNESSASTSSLIAQKERYVCAVTHDLLSNSIPCAVLKTSGSVVTMDCVERIIKKEMVDPTNGKKLEESDIIVLQRGGTGFASTNELKAEVKRPVLMA